MQLTEGETIIYSGRNDDNHMEGVSIQMSKSAARALMDWLQSVKGSFRHGPPPNTSRCTSITEEVDEQVKEE